MLAAVRTHGLDASITRGSNTYGPNQYPEKLVPLFVTNALDGEPLPLYGDGRQTRDWLHVDDHCAAIELVLRQGKAGEIYNAGGGDEVENGALDPADRRADRRRPGADPARRGPPRPRPPLRARRSKLEALGWRPQRRFDDGLPETVAWYRDNRAWWEPLKSGEFRAYYERQYAERLQ